MGGMIAATFVGILIIPAIYAVLKRLGSGKKGVLWGREDPDEDEKSDEADNDNKAKPATS